MSSIEQHVEKLDALASLSSNKAIREITSAASVQDQLLKIWNLLNPDKSAPPLPLPAAGGVSANDYVDKIKFLVQNSGNQKLKQAFAASGIDNGQKKGANHVSKIFSMVADHGDETDEDNVDVKDVTGKKKPKKSVAIKKNAVIKAPKDNIIILSQGEMLALKLSPDNASLDNVNTEDLKEFLKIVQPGPIPEDRKDILKELRPFNNPSPEVLTDRALNITKNAPEKANEIFKEASAYNARLAADLTAMEQPMEQLFKTAKESLESDKFDLKQKQSLQKCIEKLIYLESNIDKSIQKLLEEQRKTATWSTNEKITAGITALVTAGVIGGSVLHYRKKKQKNQENNGYDYVHI